jgi:hypothetical protein
MHVPRLPVLHGEQCHLCFDSIHKLLGKLGVGTGSGRLGVGSGTGDGGKAGLGVWDVQRDVEERRAGFSYGFCRQKGRDPGIAILTAMNNYTAN